MTSSAPAQASGRTVNTSWAFSLFGTAVGAGILFLPINAGSFGFWPLLIATILIAPMTYLSHRALARIMCVSPRQGEDITVVVTDYFGRKIGLVISVLYFFAIYPIVLIYGVSITNTVDSFIVNQFNGPHINRALLSFLLIGAMTLVFAFSEKLMLYLTQFIVYPLILCLAGVSIYLIPQWDLQSFMEVDSGNSLALVGGIIMILPVLVFSFNHSPAISQFSLAMQRQWGIKSHENASKVLLATALMLTVFTMFFVWSCTLALGADGLQEAREQNIPVLSYLANISGVPVLAYLSPVIAILAIISSYFGHVLGTTEGARYILKKVSPSLAERTTHQQITNIAYALIFITTWIAAVLNPDILGLIESIGGPFIAAILYLMPIWAIYRIDALKRFRGRWTNWLVVVLGVITISAAVWGLFN